MNKKKYANNITHFRFMMVGWYKKIVLQMPFLQGF